MGKRNDRQSKKKNIGIKILLLLLLITIAAAGAFFGYKYMNEDKKKEASTQGISEENITPEPEPVKTVQIYAGTDRPCRTHGNSDSSGCKRTDF